MFFRSHPMLLARAAFATAAAAIVLAAPFARADSVWITSGAGGGVLQMGGVQIQSVQDGRLVYRTNNGDERSREVAQIARVNADNEPALNAAEDALARSELDVATESFRKALASSAKEWVKVWSARRLTEVAPRANRFDAAASGYIALLVRDPGGAARAADLRPQLPPAQSTFLNSAINEATAMLSTPTLAPAAKDALQAFLAELQQAKSGGGDPAAKPGAWAPGADVMAAPNAATGGQPAAEAAPGNVAAAANAAAASAANQQLARQRLDAAGAALERKDFAAAANEIKTNAKLFTEPRDQAQALYFLAEAQTGIARAKNDVPTWQDAALAYLRVVAHFQDAEVARPFVARSMLKAAQIQETLRDPAAARTLYDQLVQQFPSDPAANDARAALERLKAKP
jgi:TolA-binding protein